MSSKFNPVRLLAVVVAALVAFIGAAAAPIYGGHPLVPVVVLAWCAVVIAVLTAVGGELARNLVTPLAAPRTSDERPLVPASMLVAVDTPRVTVTARRHLPDPPPSSDDNATVDADHTYQLGGPIVGLSAPGGSATPPTSGE